MKYTIDSKNRDSAYLQLYKQLRDDIIASVYKYGDRLPSKRMLADETGTSVITAEHAYAILCDEGYAESRQRSGYYVSYRADGFASVADLCHTLPRCTPPELHGGKYDFPFSVFAKTVRSVLSVYGERILIKSPNQGAPELREAISAYLRRSRGMDVSADQIYIGSGAEYLYGLIVQYFGRNRVYGVEDPSYEKIMSVYTANGASCDLLKLGNDGIVSEELARTKATVLHITPYRSYPSGISAGASKRREYIEWARARGGVIIEDDFESEFTVSKKHEDTVFSLEPDGSVIYINTFSKTVAPSMRMGYMVLPHTLVDSFNSKVGFYSCTVPVFEQYVLAQFIENGDFERHISRVRRARRRGQI